MPNKIHLTVAVVCEKDGQLLMVEELDNGRMVINQPAGHIEPGEPFKKAAQRETLEETGYKVNLEAVLGLSCFTSESGITYHRTSFFASCPEQEPNSDIDPEIHAVRWMTADEILRSDNHRSILVAMDIERYLSGIRYPLEMISEKA